MLSSSSSSSCSGGNLVAHQLPRPSMIDRRWKPSVELAPNCPRCDSSNTKFCYYNNYSLTQPRYFCKGCRRYWTKGGSLRNVPVGGGCRKSRRGKLIRQAVADQSCARQSSSSSRHVSIRPDLMLDDPMGSGSQASMSTEASRSDGSGIDLADLYAKFSNKTSESGPASTLTNCSLPVENIDFSGAASHDFQSNVANVGCSMLSLPGGGILSGDVLPLTEPDFDTNPISWSSQLLQLDEAVSNDLLWSSCPTMVSSSTWQPQPLQNNGFAPVPDEPSVLDTNLLDNNNWNMFDSATFEAQFF